MGREVKRVCANFDWPLGKTWDGFLMPADLYSVPCNECKGIGYNHATQKIYDSFYDNHNHGVTWHYDYGYAPDGTPAQKAPWRIIGKTKRWCDNIEQDDVQALLDAGRLIDFTHTWTQEKGWQKRTDGYTPTAQEVNDWNKNSFGHDAINHHILVKARATRLGIYGNCAKCHGEGHYFRDDKHKEAHKNWQETPVPSGEWWQVWETVSEGSPVTPAFESALELINYLVKNGDQWDQNRGEGGWTLKNATTFVQNAWAPSGVVINGEFLGPNQSGELLE